MKRTLALVLSLLMMLSLLAGCGGGGSTAYVDGSAPKVSLPTKESFPAGPVWDGVSQPTHANGEWLQSYAVIGALEAYAATYADVDPVYTFTLACHDPAASAPGEFLTAWANAVTIATQGAIDFNIGYSQAHSGTMASLDDMKNGVIDFCWTLPCYFKGYMPYTNVIQNPGLGITDATVGSQVMWELYKTTDAIQQEFAQHGETLFVWTNCTSPLSYKGYGQITSLSQVTGNIRANNGPAQTFVNEVGATVYSCAIGDVYTNVTTGVINFLVTDWHGIKSFALADPGVLNYYVDSNVGCSAYCLMANQDTWAAIPAEYQEAIKACSGDYLLNLVDIWNFWEASGRYAALENGGIIFPPSESFAAELSTAYYNVGSTWIQEQADPALAYQIFFKAYDLVKQYSADAPVA